MKTHPLNVTNLVLGLVLLGISASWALRESDVIGGAQLHWLLPLTLVAAGAVGLVAFAAKGLRHRNDDTDYDPTYDTTYHHEGDPR